MRSARLTLAVLCLPALITACSGEDEPDGVSGESAVPVINTTDATPEPGTELDADGRGRLELSRDGCVYLVGTGGPQVLVWPADYSVLDGHNKTVVTNSAGARLKVGRPVSLIGEVQPIGDQEMSCRATSDDAAIYVVDFLGKTLAGG